LAALLALTVPLYTASVILLVKSGLLSGSRKPLNDEQYKTLVAFLGTALTATAAVIGTLATWWHNKRSREQLAFDNRRLREQQALDTVAKCVELLSHETEYRPKAQVAGAVTALVHLGYPIIAMRILAVVWNEKAIDVGTACWLVGEVVKHGGPPATEATELLRSHAADLPYEVGGECYCYWPDSAYDYLQAANLVEARCRMGVSTPRPRRSRRQKR
jgi:hypothetical protein